MQILSFKISKWYLIIGLFLSLSSFVYAMSQPVTKPISMELVRVVYEKDVGAFVIELVVPEVKSIKDLSRIELMIFDSDNKATYALMLNYGDRLDPIPPGNFGVIIDPASDDRSIKNVSGAAGVPGRWDHNSSQGTLLKQSDRGVIGGNLGISVWIAPKDWALGHYVIKTRTVKWKHQPAYWQKLAEFDYTGKGVEKVIENRCMVKPILVDTHFQTIIPLKHVSTLTLIRYKKQPQDKGVTMKRWAGDTSGEYKYVETERRDLKFSDLVGGFLSLEPGFYQFKYNSVRGTNGMTSGYYGRSGLFELKSGEDLIEVRVFLHAAI